MIIFGQSQIRLGELACIMIRVKRAIVLEAVLSTSAQAHNKPITPREAKRMRSTASVAAFGA